MVGVFFSLQRKCGIAENFASQCGDMDLLNFQEFLILKELKPEAEAAQTRQLMAHISRRQQIRIISGRNIPFDLHVQLHGQPIV
ncbi:MAG: hypothetical protein L6428_09420 [Candidatus Aminicenantes bacterium]|nr:hypothetical protein [Candidatus Aminicenantes bacterium]